MMQLLIVDDEESVVDSLAGNIPWSEHGFETVHRALSGEEALRIVAAEPIDVVVSDIRMPGMDGVALIGRIRELSRRTKCLLLTGYADFAYAQEAIRSGAFNYLLKPVHYDELVQAVAGAQEAIRKEWEEISSHHRAVQALNEHLPTLREKLLLDLLRGRKTAVANLDRNTQLLHIPFAPGDRFSIMLVRLEEPFARYDPDHLTLIEYAVANIAEELLQDRFSLWHAKDDHDYLVFALKWQEPLSVTQLQHVEQKAMQLQTCVLDYLKGEISVALSLGGMFPDDILTLYGTAVAGLSRRAGSTGGMIVMTDGGEADRNEIVYLRQLYEPPTLLHLIEAGRFDEAKRKLEQIGGELLAGGLQQSTEHLSEVFFVCSASFLSGAHRLGYRLSDLADGGEALRPAGKTPFVHLGPLQIWANKMLETMQLRNDSEIKHSRASLADRVRAFVEDNLFADVSLQAIAGAIYLNPVYVSKVFKLETGEKLGNYIYKRKMEKAAQLIQSSDKKVYEIAELLGYHHTPHFIQLFRKHYGVTPQEYRKL
ncbi:response regulator [Paenibacillus cymbidii]|uniref:response regulator n=1 Tax=Paenibacillus cymbidii TaxID=1639034 RepID=UPI001436ABB8|nr:response regulator [Paenibacillus cymbidii]